jgi:hypothetical protein
MARGVLRDFRQAPLDALAVLLVVSFLGAVATFAGAVVTEVLRAPLPLARSNEVVALRSAYRGDASTAATGTSDLNLLWSEEYAAIREQTDVLADVATYLCQQSAVEATEREVVVDVCHVSADYFELVDVPTYRGQFPRPDSNEVMISFDMWRDGFGRSEAVIGDSVVVGGTRYQVSGVWQPGPGFPTRKSAAWTSGSFKVADGVRWRAPAVGRLRRGVDIRQAQDRLRATLVNATGVPAADSNLEVLALSDVRAGAVRPFVSTVGFILLLVAALAFSSVSSAVLLRTVRTERARQIRVALGARAHSVIYNDSMPTLLVVALASCVGVFLGNAWWSTVKPWLPVEHADASGWPRSAAAFLLTVGVSVAASIAPAWRAWRQVNRHTHSLQSKAAGSGDKAQAYLRDAILVAHIVSVGGLLVVALSVGWSWIALIQRDSGIVVNGVAVLKISPDASVDGSVEARVRLFEVLRAEAESALGPDSRVGVVNILPFTSANTYRSARRADVPFSESGDVMAALRIVSPGYFSALKVSPLNGRVFSDADVHGTERVILLSENLAAKLFGQEPALGRGVRCYPEVCTVVGVVPAVRHSIYEAPEMAMYVPLAQSSGISLSSSHVAASWLVARAPGVDNAALQRVSERLEASSVGLSIAQKGTLAQLVADQLRPRMLATAAMAMLGAAGLMLVAVAVYILFSRAIQDREADLTIRAALGASPSRLVRDVAGRSIALVVASGGVGVAAGISLLSYVIAPSWYPELVAETTVWKAAALAFGVLCASVLLAASRSCARLWRADVASMLRH